MVVAPGTRVAEAALAEGRAAELGREDHQRVLEHAARLQVFDQGGRRLVDVVALVGQLTREGDVLVPTAVEELDEADVAFEQAAGQQAVGRIGARAGDLGAVGRQGLAGFLGDVGQLRHRGLHAEGHLVGLHAGDGLGVADLLGPLLVEGGQVVQQGAALLAVDGGRVLQVEHGVGARTQADALVAGRQEAAAPEAREDRLARVLAGALRDHRDERGEVGVLGAEAIARPGAHAGVTRLLVPRVHERDRRVVVDRLGVEALDEAQLVGDRLQVREQVADPEAVLAAKLAVLEGGRARVAALAAGHAGQALRAFHGGRQVLAGHLLQHRLVVEEVDVREAAGLEEAEHALGLGGEVRQAR